MANASLFLVRVKATTNPRAWTPGRWCREYQNAYSGRSFEMVVGPACASVYSSRNAARIMVDRYTEQLYGVTLEIVEFGATF